MQKKKRRRQPTAFVDAIYTLTHEYPEEKVVNSDFNATPSKKDSDSLIRLTNSGGPCDGSLAWCVPCHARSKAFAISRLTDRPHSSTAAAQQ